MSAPQVLVFYWLTTLSTNFWWMEKSLVASYLNTHHTCSSSWNQCKFFNTRWKISLIIATIWSVIYTHRERSIFLSIIHLSVYLSISQSNLSIILPIYESKAEILTKHFWDILLYFSLSLWNQNWDLGKTLLGYRFANRSKGFPLRGGHFQDKITREIVC